MTATDVFRRTPLRLAAIFTALFFATAVLIFSSLYVQLGRELENGIRSRVEETAQALSAVGREKGFSELADLIESEAGSVRDYDAIYLLAGSAGDFRAGNVRGIARESGWLALSRSGLTFVTDRGDPGDVFLARWFEVNGGHLLVGLSDGEIRKTRAILLEGLAYALAGTLLVAGLFGALLAWKAQTRIAAISTTLDAVTKGDLGARVVMSGSGDDFDHIGEQINRTLKQLKTLVDNVNQSSSDIAHDLKRPIGRLQQKLDEARWTAKTPEEFQKAIDLAMRDLDSIVETFEALLNITQIEAGARKSRFETVDLRTVLADIADVYEAVADDAGHRLDVSNDLDRPANVSGDKELLVQLIANLIENSIQHCPRGARIGLSLASAGGGYLLSVADDGPGIPAEERSNVLRRLYRLERARSTPGSGLGLSLVAAISELHGATLELMGNDPGLKVCITFPQSEM